MKPDPKRVHEAAHIEIDFNEFERLKKLGLTCPPPGEAGLIKFKGQAVGYSGLNIGCRITHKEFILLFVESVSKYVDLIP